MHHPESPMPGPRGDALESAMERFRAPRGHRQSPSDTSSLPLHALRTVRALLRAWLIAALLVAMPVLAQGAALSAGFDFTCTLRADGSALCWGQNQAGQLGIGTTSPNESVPVEVAGLNEAVALSSGIGHTCAALANGEAWCWGRNDNGALGDGSTTQRNAPVAVRDGDGALTGVAAIAAGHLHSCARLGDGTAACWGWNNNGQLGNGGVADSAVAVAVSGLADVVALAAGVSHTCAIVTGGGVRCWGNNALGQLGNGSGDGSSPTPVTVRGIDDAVAIAARNFHTCVVLGDGEVRCWGDNDEGQLGNFAGSFSNVPVAMSYIDDAVGIAAGVLHACAVRAGGGVRCWGDNSGDQSGPGSSQDLALQAPATTLALGFEHSCALTPDGTVFCWGDNQATQLGRGTVGMAQRPTPQPVLALNDAAQVSVGGSHSCVLTTTGRAKCWGNNNFGQLGDGSTVDRFSPPLAMPGVSGVQALGVGGQFGCVRVAGNARCLGRNDDGQLGLGKSSFDPVTTPTPLEDLGPIVSISNGFNHSCAVVAGGAVRCWGYNSFGQLGDGSTENSNTPVAVSGITGATAVSVGGSHSCALVAGGQVRCWGNGFGGQLGNGEFFEEHWTPVAVSGLSGAVAIDAGGGHTCALMGDGDVRCWGANDDGQIGDGGLQSGYATPLTVVNLSNATAISAGDAHTCAIAADATVRCWGQNTEGQLGNDDLDNASSPVAVLALDDVVSISAGDETTCAVRDDGSTYCWGRSAGGLLGNGELFKTRVPVEVLGTSPRIFGNGFE